VASLSFAVSAWRFGVPASRAGARGVVEDEVARGALAALQAGHVDLAELKRDPASQRCRGRGFAPLELRVQCPVVGHAEPHPRGARSRKLGQPRGRPGYRAPAQKSVHQPNDCSVKLAYRAQLGGAQARQRERLHRCCGTGEGVGTLRGTTARLTRYGQVRKPQQRVRRHARLTAAWPTKRIRGRETSSFARCALGWLAYRRRDSSARSRLVH
jgi:hypothetical protein